MKLLKIFLLLFISSFYFSSTSAWRRRRRRRCDSSSCSWVWGGCSRTCGGGRQNPRITRSRGSCGPACNLPAPRSCNNHCCPINCQWGQWGSWGLCSASCGGGTSVRNRNYVTRESCGGRSCSGSSSESRPCSTDCCPVNCEWGEWGSWGDCSTTCGSGVKTKGRVVSIPSICGGNPCSGSDEEESVCDVGPCPINCEWEAWGAWNDCSVSCGGGGQSRFREVQTAAQYGGLGCDGDPSESRTCNDVCCPTECVWGDWTAWGDCSLTCSGGTQSRRRSISTPESCGGVRCDGDAEENQVCNDVCCPISCELASWSRWGSCSATCGSGEKTRSRGVARVATCGGSPCSETMMESEECNTHCCAVDCQLAEWQDWSTCSATCGVNGTTLRQRVIKSPATCGGTCFGQLSEKQACNRVCFHEGRINESTCACPLGWEGECCDVDVDECMSGRNNCSEMSECRNNNGSFTCICLEGFTGNGTSCQNLNECSAGLHDCHPAATCTDTSGSFTCWCRNGYSGTGRSCEDIDECDDGNFPCHEQAVCRNTEGGFSCLCGAGYSGNGTSCENVNECGAGSHQCNQHASCQDSEGSYRCSCSGGYSGSGRICSDINECMTSLFTCHLNATCMNVIGSYKCLCKSGFTGDGKQCEDLDECNLNTCGANTYCRNTLGSFQCLCRPGFTTRDTHGSGESFSGVEMRGDSQNIETEQDNAEPKDLSSGYFFNEGSSGEVLSCVDINECMTLFAECHVNATCTNVIGSYKCQCKPGFTGDGKQCEVYNYCWLDADDCDSNAECVGKGGEYECVCKDGFTGSGKECEATASNSGSFDWILLLYVGGGVLVAVVVGIAFFLLYKKHKLLNNKKKGSFWINKTFDSVAKSNPITEKDL